MIIRLLLFLFSSFVDGALICESEHTAVCTKYEYGIRHIKSESEREKQIYSFVFVFVSFRKMGKLFERQQNFFETNKKEQREMWKNIFAFLLWRTETYSRMNSSECAQTMTMTSFLYIK